MTKKVLVDVNEPVHTYTNGQVGVRVVEVVDPGEEFECVYIWVDSDIADIAPDRYCYIEATNTFMKTDIYSPAVDSNGAPFELLVPNVETHTYDWDNQYWVAN